MEKSFHCAAEPRGRAGCKTSDTFAAVMASGRPSSRALLGAAALVAAAVLAHAPALDAGFVRFDDTAYVEGNPHVASGLRLANVRWALTGYDQSNWHPLTWISHMIDVELFGFEPRGHHAVNVALHAIDAALLFLVLRALTRDEGPSWLVAAVFALHPANVESVAWIAQRKTLLSTCFALLSIGAYARWARERGRGAYAASLGCFALSLASKPMFVTLPFALLLLDFWPLQRAPLDTSRDHVSAADLVRAVWRWLPDKLPYAALAAAVAVITLDAQRDAMSTIDHYPLSQRLGNVALSYVRYLATFFAPVRLAVFYPLYPEKQTAARIAGAAIVLLALTIALCRLGLRRRYLLVGWLWFLLTLVPVIGLVQVGMQSMADRYAYVPFWGVAIALAWSLRDVVGPRLGSLGTRATATATAAIALGALAVLTHRQAERWHDSFTLFESALANTEDNWLAHGVLAERYYATGDFAKTIDHSLAAIRFHRNLGTVRSTYGLALHDTGKPALALEQFELATQQEPENPDGWMNLGWMQAERGDYENALATLAIASGRIRPTTIPYTRKTIYANWASALAKVHRLDEAREKYARALEIEPDDRNLLRDAARVDLRLREPDRAVERLDRVLSRAPDDVDAAWLLASAAALQGHDATPLFARAQALDVRHATVTVDLARTLAGDGRVDDATRLLDQLLALDPPADPDDARFVAATARDQLAEIALAHGDVAGAVAELDRALVVAPDDFDASSRLAFVLATSTDPAYRDPARAVALAERALAQKRDFASLSTLAAAYAAAGRSADAVGAARAGLELARAADDPRAIANLQKQVDLYSGAVSAAPPR